MIPNVTRGGRMAGLLSYLAGPGRANEHTHPMIVAGDERVTFAVPVGHELSASDAFEVAYLMEQPHRFHDRKVMVPVKEWDEERQEKVKVGEKDGHVWHCSLSLRADDRQVSAEEWGKIASRFVEEMGFIDPDGAKSSRWVAVHHGTSKNGNDHIHIAVQMVTEDGSAQNVNKDFARTQRVARQLEKEFGLAVVEGRDADQTLGAYKPAEMDRARRAGNSLPVPVQLRQRMRAALATADSPLAYLRALEDAGVTVAPSFQKGSRNAVRGYKVALAGQEYTTREGRHVFASPSKLDASLSWPNVCARFGGKGQQEAERYLAALHGTKRTNAVQHSTHARMRRPVDSVHVERLMSGKKGTGPDTLASIYGRLAVEFEARKDGPLGRMSEHMARAQHSAGGGAWRVRQTARFAKGGERGWMALLRQANRLSRAMTQEHMSRSRPQLAQDVLALVSASEHWHKSLFKESTTSPRVPVEGTRTMQRETDYGR